MKKIIVLFGMVAVLFYSGLFSKADSSSSAVHQYHQTFEFSGNDSVILESGYYILYSFFDYIDTDWLKGDVTTTHSDGVDIEESEADRSVLQQYLSVPENKMAELDMLQQELKENLYNGRNWSIPYDGIYFAKINGCAVLAPTVNLYIECFYIKEEISASDMTISGGKTHLVDISSPLTLEQIQQRYYAVDQVDGTIDSSQLYFESNYPEKIALGQYYILVWAKDRQNNVTYSADYILVKDLSSPIVELKQEKIVVDVHDVYTSEDAKKLFTFSDNYTPSEELICFWDDRYQSNFDTIGTYTIGVYCKDKDGNASATKTLTIEVKDRIAPTIQLKDGVEKIISDHPLNEDEIKSYFIVTDNYYELSNNELVVVSNTCDGTEGKDFKIVISITDPSGNQETKEFLYYITDPTGPIIYVKDTLYLPKDQLITNEQLLEMLKNAGLISKNATAVTVTSSYFDASGFQKEQYDVLISETFSDQTTVHKVITLQIIDSKSDSSYWIVLPCVLILGGLSLTIIRKKRYELTLFS